MQVYIENVSQPSRAVQINCVFVGTDTKEAASISVSPTLDLTGVLRELKREADAREASAALVTKIPLGLVDFGPIDGESGPTEEQLARQAFQDAYHALLRALDKVRAGLVPEDAKEVTALRDEAVALYLPAFAGL